MQAAKGLEVPIYEQLVKPLDQQKLLKLNYEPILHLVE